MMIDERQGQLLRLVERDYDQTAEFIRSVVGTVATTRGWAVTVWLAVLGVAVQQEQWQLAVLAGIAVAPFFLLDAYHSWLYGRALGHARALEALEARGYRVIESAEDDPDLAADLDAELAAHRFGLYRNFRRFSVREVHHARPRLVFMVFYPGLVAIAAAAALLIGLSSSPGHSSQGSLVATARSKRCITTARAGAEHRRNLPGGDDRTRLS